MPDYRRTGHSVSPLYAHLVFVTKYRRRVFNDAMLTDCENTHRAVGENAGIGGGGVQRGARPRASARAVSAVVGGLDPGAPVEGCLRAKAPDRLHRTVQPCPDARPPLDALLLRGLRRRSTAIDHQAIHRKLSQTHLRQTRATARGTPNPSANPGLKSRACAEQISGSPWSGCCSWWPSASAS